MSQLHYQRQTSNVASGTSKQGTVKATFDELVSVFGEPEIMPYEYKLNHLWVVNIEGVIATIYDYKEDLKTGKDEDWHIGSKQKVAERLVNQVLAENINVPADFDNLEDYEQDQAAAAETIANGDY